MAEYKEPKFVKWIMEGDKRSCDRLIGTAQQFLNTIRGMNKGGFNVPIIRRTLADGSEITAKTHLPGVDIVTIRAQMKEKIEKRKVQNYIVGRYGAVSMSGERRPTHTYFWGCEFPKGETWVTLVGDSSNKIYEEYGITMDMDDYGLVATVHSIYSVNNSVVVVYASHDYGKSFKKLPDVLSINNDWIRCDVEIRDGIIYVITLSDINNIITIYKYVPGDVFNEGTWEGVYSIVPIDRERQHASIDFNVYKDAGDDTVKFMWSTLAADEGSNSLLIREYGTELYCGDDYPVPWPSYGVFVGVTGVYRLFLDNPATNHNGDIYLLADTIQTKDLRYVSSYGEDGRYVTCPFCATDGKEDSAPHAWNLWPYEYYPGEAKIPLSERCPHFRDYSNRPAFTVNPVEFSDDYTETAVIRDGCDNVVWTSRSYPPIAEESSTYKVSGYYDVKSVFIEYDKNSTHTWVITASHLGTNGAAVVGNCAVLVSIDNGETFSVVEIPEAGVPFLAPNYDDIARGSEGAILDGIVVWGHQRTHGSLHDWDRFVIYAGYLNKDDMTINWQTLFEDNGDKDYYGATGYQISYITGNIKIVKGKEKEVT